MHDKALVPGNPSLGKSVMSTSQRWSYLNISILFVVSSCDARGLPCRISSWTTFTFSHNQRRGIDIPECVPADPFLYANPNRARRRIFDNTPSGVSGRLALSQATNLESNWGGIQSKAIRVGLGLSANSQALWCRDCLTVSPPFASYTYIPPSLSAGLFPTI